MKTIEHLEKENEDLQSQLLEMTRLRDYLIKVSGKHRLAAQSMKNVLVQIDKYWFDPTSEEGACSLCDANLHPNCMGKHAQLNGDPCPFQLAHDVLKEQGE